MANIDARRKEKRSTVSGQAPTVAPSNDHLDGTWSVTDIYPGEFFINLVDEKVYTRTNAGIIQVNQVATGALQPVTLQQMNAALVGLWDDRGNYDASTNLFPSSGGSGTFGALLKGDIFTISVAGVLEGVSVNVSDTVRVLVDSPGQTAANWAIGGGNLGYTPLSNVLNSAKIFVGNASNVATGVDLTLNATAGKFALSSAGVLTMPDSETGTRGLLNATDWNTFNNKQNALGFTPYNSTNPSNYIALTELSGTSPITYNNTTGDIGFSSTYAGNTSLTTLGTVSTGSWGASIISPTFGGTGVNNGSNTLTLSGNLTTTGAFNPTFAIPRTTTWTLPNTANETLAGLGTAQNFTATQGFNTINIFNSNTGTYTQAFTPSVTSSAFNQNAVMYSAGIRGLSNNLSLGASTATTTLNAARSLTVATLNLSGSSQIYQPFRLFTGDNTGNDIATPTQANSQDIDVYTGNLTDATNNNSVSGSIRFDIGTTANAGSTRGGISFFNGQATPAWNNGQRVMFIGNRTAAPTTNASGGTYLYSESGKLNTTGGLYFPLIGTGIGVKTGINGRLFTATLSSGTVTVSNSSVTSNTKAIITLSPSGASGTLGNYTYTVSSGSIVITSLTTAGVTQTLDTSTVQVYLVEGL